MAKHTYAAIPLFGGEILYRSDGMIRLNDLYDKDDYGKMWADLRTAYIKEMVDSGNAWAEENPNHPQARPMVDASKVPGPNAGTWVHPSIYAAILCKHRVDIRGTLLKIGLNLALTAAEVHRDQLKERGITDEQVIQMALQFVDMKFPPYVEGFNKRHDEKRKRNKGPMMTGGGYVRH